MLITKRSRSTSLASGHYDTHVHGQEVAALPPPPCVHQQAAATGTAEYMVDVHVAEAVALGLVPAARKLHLRARHVHAQEAIAAADGAVAPCDLVRRDRRRQLDRVDDRTTVAVRVVHGGVVRVKLRVRVVTHDGSGCAAGLAGERRSRVKGKKDLRMCSMDCADNTGYGDPSAMALNL
jgi:hypothetical protein